MFNMVEICGYVVLFNCMRWFDEFFVYMVDKIVWWDGWVVGWRLCYVGFVISEGWFFWLGRVDGSGGGVVFDLVWEVGYVWDVEKFVVKIVFMWILFCFVEGIWVDGWLLLLLNKCVGGCGIVGFKVYLRRNDNMEV